MVVQRIIIIFLTARATQTNSRKCSVVTRGYSPTKYEENNIKMVSESVDARRVKSETYRGSFNNAAFI